MKLEMLSTKSGLAFSYFISGGTGASGVARMTQEQAMMIEPHIVFGFSLSEVAILIGIIGTFATMVFQYLNYKNIKKKND